MRQQSFWSGVGAGAALGALAGAACVLAFKKFTSDTGADIVRLEKSMNVGRPIDEVFSAWSDFERLPELIRFVEQVERSGSRTRWRVNIDGAHFEWEAQMTQIIPRQSIGWKSLKGPRHTGRINFAPLGDQTVIHVTMNYVPPLGPVGSMLPLEGHLEDWIERGLREFKLGLERAPEARTGTMGGAARPARGGRPGKRTPPGTAEYTRPPEAKS